MLWVESLCEWDWVLPAKYHRGRVGIARGRFTLYRLDVVLAADHVLRAAQPYSTAVEQAGLRVRNSPCGNSPRGFQSR